MAIFYVYQNQTYAHEHDGGYVWSPQRNKSGGENQGYRIMTEIRKGDFIIHHASTAIQAISIALTDCYNAQQPGALKNAKTDKVKPRQTTTTTYYRNPVIAKAAKERAGGVCQLCGMPAPFMDKDGNPYLESHHIIWLSAGGEDTVENTVALCPNCHKRMHVLNEDRAMKVLQSRNRRR